MQLRRFGDGLIIDDKLQYGPQIQLAENALVLGGGAPLRRVERPKPMRIPPNWTGLIGEYGWDNDIVYILERDGKLTSLMQWHEYEPLEWLSNDHFRYPQRGLYDHEPIVFNRGKDGLTTGVIV